MALIPGSGLPPIPIFPTLPQGFPVKVSIVLDTTIGTTKSLREMRYPQQSEPIWDIEILFEELLDQTQNSTIYFPFNGYQEYEDLVELWLSMYGQAGIFAFDCPWDDSRQFQYIATGDGVTTSFSIIRTWGLGDLASSSIIGAVNTITAVYVSGFPVTTYSAAGNTLSFVTAPGAGAIITMTFSFYYLCRFVEDEQNFEEFGKNRWKVSSLKLRSAPTTPYGAAYLTNDFNINITYDDNSPIIGAI